IGTSRAATSGCDFGLDQAKPPVPAMGQYLYTAIDDRDWANSPGDYAVDVRTSGQKSAWDLKVYTNMVGQKVRLSWGDMSGLPNDVKPMLLDLDSGRQVYMRTCSVYAFTAGKSARRLQVVIGPDGPGMLSISPQAAVPTAAGTAISYTLSQSANVDVVVSNLAGRVVRRVVVDQMQTAGQNSVLWDGRDAGGLLTPQGRYLVTIVGRTASGQQFRSIMPLQRVSH
ncbi:MAG: FlgD immunoglobulin-like domain containing protein, partial [Armatimonadota bacterium]